MSTLKQRVTSLPYEQQIRLALEAVHELVENEGYTFDFDSFCEGKRCCVGGAFYRKYGVYSSKQALSTIAFRAMLLEGKDDLTLPSLEAMLKVAKKGGYL